MAGCVNDSICVTYVTYAHFVRTGGRKYGTIYSLSGIELRGDGGMNGSLESRGLKLIESC